MQHSTLESPSSASRSAERDEQLHRSRLYLAGIDPSTNIGMSNLCRIHRHAVAENEYDGDMVVLILLRDFVYAFGSDARFLSRVAKRIVASECGDAGLGKWVAIDRCRLHEAEAILRHYVDIRCYTHEVNVVDSCVREGGAA